MVERIGNVGKKSPDQTELLRALLVQIEVVLVLNSGNTSRKAQAHLFIR